MIGALVCELTVWLERLPPPQPRMDVLGQTLRAQFGGRDEPVTAAGLAAVEAAAHPFCRHLELEHHPAGDLVVDRTAPGWPAEDAAPIRRRAGGVSAVRRTADGFAVLAVDGLPDYAVARPYLDAAIALTAGARGVALDLRRNGGGDPATVAAMVGWLCGPDEPVSEVVYRDRVRPWTTPADPPTLPGATPVVILIGPGTFSSGEALAYHLQARGRGPLVGQPTPGAADHVTPVNLARDVRAILPEAYVVDAVTGTNWEGTGVRPDRETQADDTEATALAELRERAD